MTNIGEQLGVKSNINDWSIYKYDVIDSTNEQIKRLIPLEENKKLIVICNKQTKGKGRLSRGWLSPYKCGLYVSWVFANFSFNKGILPVLIGFNCLKYLKTLIKDEMFLKWPNDLIVRDKKLGGILIENFKDFIIVGVGINLIQNNELPPNAISLNMLDIGCTFDFNNMQESLLVKFTEILEGCFDSLRSNEYFDLNELCNHLSTPPGAYINYVKEDEIFSGQVVGLEQGGGLIIQAGNKEYKVLLSEEISICL